MNQPRKLHKLYELVELMRKGEPIPKEYKPHNLIGDYVGHMECHIEGDFLLVWIDETTNIVKLIRLGSHSEIFGLKAILHLTKSHFTVDEKPFRER
jgi:mRNA interferase YafQ